MAAVGFAACSQALRFCGILLQASVLREWIGGQERQWCDNTAAVPLIVEIAYA
jgi:hypothetical protein